MERQHYEIPLQHLLAHLITQQVPEDAVIHYWYERVIPAKKAATSTPKKKGTDWKAQWSKAAGMWSDYDGVEERFREIRLSLNTRIPQ